MLGADIVMAFEQTYSTLALDGQTCSSAKMLPMPRSSRVSVSGRFDGSSPRHSGALLLPGATALHHGVLHACIMHNGIHNAMRCLGKGACRRVPLNLYDWTRTGGAIEELEVAAE